MPQPLYGQVVVSGTPQTLAVVPTEVAAFTVKASAANTAPVFLGDKNVTLTTGYRLDPGDQLEYERTDQRGRYALRPADFWVVGTGPDTVSWLASP